jgi:hypothetical protein
MAQYFTRKKNTPFLLRFFYLLDEFKFLKIKTKLNLFLDLEWIFQCLPHKNKKTTVVAIVKYKLPNLKFIYIKVPNFEATILNQYRIDIESNYRHMDDHYLAEYNRSELIKMLNNRNLKIVDREYQFGVQKHWCLLS